MTEAHNKIIQSKINMKTVILTKDLYINKNRKIYKQQSN